MITASCTITGLQNNDTAENVLTGALTTTATKTSNIGNYTITQGTLALAGATPHNYTLSFTNGTLTMRKAAQDAPASGEGYTVADGRITVKSDTNAKANNETHYEVYEFSGESGVSKSSPVTIEANKTYRIRWAGNEHYEPSLWTTIVAEATVTATASPASMGEITGLAENG